MDNPSQVLSILVVVYLACSIASRIYVCSASAQFTFSTLSNYHPLNGGHSITPGLSDSKRDDDMEHCQVKQFAKIGLFHQVAVSHAELTLVSRGSQRRTRNALPRRFVSSSCRSLLASGGWLGCTCTRVPSWILLPLAQYGLDAEQFSLLLLARPILNRLCQMRRFDPVAFCQIRNRPREFEDAMIRARAHLHLLHCCTQ